MRALAAMLAVGGCGGAAADGGPSADVIEVVAHGVRIDWTTLQLEVTADASTAGPQTVEGAEQLARRAVDAAYDQAVGSVRVTADARVADLVADSDLGAAIRSRVSRWEVVRAEYGTSGRVELVASLSLQELLRPWALQIARPGVPPVGGSPVTGVVVDARGTGIRPAYALRLIGPDGRVLYAGEQWEEEAVTAAPYRFVQDPAHPAASGAGDRPLLLIAADVRGSDLVLGDADAELLSDRGSDGVLGRTTVVVVVDGG